MKKNKRIPALIVSVILAAAILFASIPAVSASSGNYAKYKDFYSVAHISEEILEDYFDSLSPEIDELLDLYVEYSLYELTKEEAVIAMLKTFLNDYYSITPYLGDSLLKAFDEFGGYYSNVSTDDLFDTESYVGYGVIIAGERIVDARRYQPVVTHVIRNSPAESVGIQKGDEFIEINDINVEGFGMEAVTDLMATTKGKTKFVLKRGDEEISVEMTKANVKYESVSYEIIDESKKLAVLTIANFTDESLLLEMSAILDILSKEGYKNLIIDLRDNPGGSLEYLYEALDCFVIKEDVKLGTVLLKDGKKEDVFSTADYGVDFDKISVLINGYTASAAEAFALAISELKDTNIIGETTYGKGIGQRYEELTNGDVAGITSLELISPKGAKYHGDGIAPDISISMKYIGEDKAIKDKKFEQLNFVNCYNITEDADNNVVLGLNQRLAKIGYIEPEDVSSKCTQKTITAVEIFQGYCGLPIGIEKIDYVFLEYLNYFVSSAPSLAIDGDAQLECAIKLMFEGEKAAKAFADVINKETEDILADMEDTEDAMEKEDTEDEDVITEEDGEYSEDEEENNQEDEEDDKVLKAGNSKVLKFC